MSSIVDEYKFLFTADNKNVDATLNTINAKMNNLSKSLSSIFKVTIFGKMISGVNSLVNSYKDLAINTDKLSKFTGLSIENIGKYEQSLNKLGISADETKNNLLNLSQNLDAVRLGGSNVLEVAKRFGIAFKNTNGSLMKSDEYLKNLVSKLSNYSDSTKKLIMNQLGLSENLQYQILDNIDLVGQALNEQGDNKATYSQDDVKIAKELNTQYAKINLLLQKMKLLLSRFLAPIVLKILQFTEIIFKQIKNIFKFVEQHQSFFNILLMMVAWNRLLKPILTSFFKIGKHLNKIKSFLPLIKRMLMPLVRFFAKFVAIPLLLDDFFVALQGGDSYIGNLAKKFKIIEISLKKSRAVLDKIMNFIKNPSWEGLYNVFEEIAYQFVKTFIDIFAFIWDWFDKKVSSFYEMLFNAFKNLASSFKDIFNSVIEWLGEKINAILNPIKNIGNSVSQKVGKVKGNISNAYNNVVNNVKGFFGFNDNTQNLAPIPVIGATNNYATTNNSNQNKQIIYNNQKISLSGEKAFNYVKDLNLMTMQLGNKGAL